MFKVSKWEKFGYWCAGVVTVVALAGVVGFVIWATVANAALVAAVAR